MDVLWVVHQIHVCTLSGRVLPHPAGYELHLPFGYRHTFFQNEIDRIKPDDENRSYWQYKGKPILLLGGNKVVNPFQMEQQEMMSYLDELQSAGGNYFRNVMSDRESGNVKAFKKESRDRKINGSGKRYLPGRVNNRLQRYSFDLPANVSAELMLEFGPNDAVSLNGEKVNTQFGTIRLSPGRNEIELQVNSF
jgi:hypothetical protein